MVLGHGVQAATTAGRGESAGVKRTAVEDVLAALSMETSEGSIPDPSKHVRQRSKMHEVEMDENKVVMHTRRGSTAVGVTPSDPSAIVDLFQEVESIGDTYLPPDETDSEDEDSSHHKAADAAADTAAAAASGGSAAASSDPPGQQQQSNADSASSVGSTTNEQQHHASSDENNVSASAAAAAAGDSQKHRVGAAGKLWAQQEQEPEPSTSSPPPPPPSDTPVQMVEPAWGSGGDPQAPRPYWPTHEEAAGVASGEGGAVVTLGGKEGGVEANGKRRTRWSRRSIKIGSRWDATSRGCMETHIVRGVRRASSRGTIKSKQRRRRSPSRRRCGRVSLPREGLPQRCKRPRSASRRRRRSAARRRWGPSRRAWGKA
ncbi:unnamed protein product [Ectocarpus sp. 6 AP-2014]